MHGRDYAGQRVAGWLVQEKFNGLRCLWTGSKLVSRNGERFNAPAWFTAGLPDVPLDGELFAGVGTLGRISNKLARWKSGADCDWQGVAFHVFDVPVADVGFQRRAAMVVARVGAARHAVAVETAEVHSLTKLRSALKVLHGAGGEGFVLRHPAAHYTVGRTDSLLKFKAPHLY